MGLRGFFRHLSERALLRSALDLEKEIHGLYEALDSELADEGMPEELLRVLSEEKEHKQLLVNILGGRIRGKEAELVLSRGRFHDLGRVQPLDRDAFGPVWRRLQGIRQREADIRLFYEGLCRKAKLPAVRRVLCFLAEQEDIHVELLDRLLGNPVDPG